MEQKQECKCGHAISEHDINGCNYVFIHADTMKSHCSCRATRRTLAANQSQTALKLRFHLLKSAVVMEVLEQDKDALGVIPLGMLEGQPNFEAVNGLFIGNSKFVNIFDASRQQLSIGTQDGGLVSIETAMFSVVKEALTEFAEAGAFFGSEKPVPRIERNLLKEAWNSEGEYVLETRTTTYHYSEAEFSALAILAPELSSKIYEPKPRFSSEWKQISPRRWEIVEDMSRAANYNILYDLRDAETKEVLFSDTYSTRLEDAANQLNRESDLQVWEFTMRCL